MKASDAKVLVATPLPPGGEDLLGVFRQVDHLHTEVVEPATLISRGRDCQAIICSLKERIDVACLSDLPALLAVGNVAVGYDNIDIQACTEHGVAVLNTPHVLDETTADLAFALMLAVARRVVEADAEARHGKWTGMGMNYMLGADVWGKTLGIVGYGRIGQAVARRARGFGMRVIYVRSPSSSLPATTTTDSADLPFCLPGQDLLPQQVSLTQLLQEADFVSLNCPLTEATRHLIGEPELRLMKRGAFIINTARGAVVDELALIRSLENGHLGGAGLDVYENEPHIPKALQKLKNVVLTPHIGSATRETRLKMARLAIEGVCCILNGAVPSNLVNPECCDLVFSRLRAL